MLRETRELVPRSTSNLRYEEHPIGYRQKKKITEIIRGVTPVVMSRSIIDNNLHKKDMHFEYHCSTKKVLNHRRNVLSEGRFASNGR